MSWTARLAVAAPLAVLALQAQAQVGDTYDNGTQVRIGQYSTQASTPGHSVSDPLSVFVALTYPRQDVATIDGAIEYTLKRTGWQLDRSKLSLEAAQFLRLPLPESQRSLGTYRVRDVLKTLVGETWRWDEDPIRRRLWISLAAQPTLSGVELTQNWLHAQTYPVTVDPKKPWLPLTERISGVQP